MKKLMVLLLWPTRELFCKSTPGTVKVHNSYTCGHEFWLTVYHWNGKCWALHHKQFNTWFTLLLNTIRVVFNCVCSSKLHPKPKWSFWPTTLRAQTVQVKTQIKYVYVNGWCEVWENVCIQSDSQVVLAFLLSGQESGACCRNQSQSPVMQNQCRCEFLWHWEEKSAPKIPISILRMGGASQGSLTLPKRYKQLCCYIPGEMGCWAIAGPLEPP